jgi:hypothetical protein
LQHELQEEGDIPVLLGNVPLLYRHLYAESNLIDGQRHSSFVINLCGDTEQPMNTLDRDSDASCTYDELKRYLSGNTRKDLGIAPTHRRVLYAFRVCPFRAVGALLHLAYQVRGVPTIVVSLALGACIPHPLGQLVGIVGLSVGGFMLMWGMSKALRIDE